MRLLRVYLFFFFFLLPFVLFVCLFSPCDCLTKKTIGLQPKPIENKLSTSADVVASTAAATVAVAVGPSAVQEPSFTLAQLDRTEGAYDPARPNDYAEFKAMTVRVASHQQHQQYHQHQQRQQHWTAQQQQNDQHHDHHHHHNHHQPYDHQQQSQQVVQMSDDQKRAMLNAGSVDSMLAMRRARSQQQQH
jgi:ABC-type Zn2+ transport system substrate-binding protein/surface adhesin